MGATNSGGAYSFTYNDEGIRTSKTRGSRTTTYYLDGNTIIAEETNGDIYLYIYDVSGLPIGMKYRASDYAANVWDIFRFDKNLQGDVIAVYDEEGRKLVSYSYDAWGKCSVGYSYSGVEDYSPAANNPFRYNSIRRRIL